MTPNSLESALKVARRFQSRPHPFTGYDKPTISSTGLRGWG